MPFTPDKDKRPPLPSQRPDNYVKPIKFAASKIENVDGAVVDFIKDLKLSVNKTSGFQDVPIIWVSPERAYSAKRDELYRDADGTLIYPLISVERATIRKDLTVKGTVWANIPPVNDEKGGSIQVARRIKQDTTSKFQNSHSKRKRGQINFPNLKSSKIVYETVSMPLPVYVEITYKILVRAEYQQQMNELITPFITKPGGVNYIVLRRDGHTYEGFIQSDFKQNNNFRSFTREERKLETEIEIKVLAYLMGQGKNQDQPTYVVRENAVQIKIPRERIITEDKPEHTGGRHYGLAGVIKPRRGSRKASFDDPFSTSGTGGGAGPSTAASSTTGGVREYTAGSGITLNGSEFSIDTNVVVTDLSTISGTLATYHTFDGDKGVFNDLDVSGTTRLVGDVTVVGTIIGGSPVKISGSLEVIDDTGTTVAVLGSSSLGNNILSASLTTTQALTASGGIRFEGLSSAVAVSSKYLALDSNNNVVLTGAAAAGSGGSGGTIGNAEDGSYADGLFTDFTSTTPVGTPIDRFNEVLKILAPSPAPDLASINENVTDGVAAKLSFGSSLAIADYTSSATAAGFSAVDINGSYSATNNARNLRLGVYDGTQDITGLLNDNVAASVTNGYVAYASGAFGNAEVGTLKLEVNGNIIHSINLATHNGSGNPGSGTDSALNADTSGFTNVSVTASSFDGNNAEWYIFKHRTARYKVDKDSMVSGWNYARIIHTFGGTDKTTNYVEWVNDPSGAVNNLAATRERIEDITLVGSKFLSGVKYNTNATAKYKVDLANLYQNVYAASGTPISFTVANSSTPAAQAVPSINNGAGEDSTKVLSVTASLNVNANTDTLLSGAITSNVTATHPLKSTLSNGGAATTGNGFLIDNRTLASTNLSEKFHDETFRKASGSFDTQVNSLAGAYTWNSRNHMTASGATGHTDGLLFYNQRLYSPVDADIPALGNFGSIPNVSNNQPNYSGVTGLRTFFRVVSNSSGVTKRDFKITSTKVGTTYNNSTPSNTNVNFFAKIPGATGWMDISENFNYGRIETGDGALISSATNDTDNANNVHHISFGTASVANGERIMIKIVADESWTGYISQLDFQLGATSNSAVESAALDDIDMNNSGISDANLSFGVSHTIPSYSSATGSSISTSNFDTNGNYTLSGDRRGVFGTIPTVTGELNEDVSANGDNYPANSFKDALSGQLVLSVNGSEVKTTDISSTINAITSDFNGNSSGFSVSSVGFSTTADGIPDYTKPYRTGTYQIGSGDQRLGWNYARVIHRFGGSDTTTNYVEWVNDTNSNALSASYVDMSKFDHPNVFRQSGVGYFATRPTASYTYTAAHVYKNVYQQGTAVSFPTTTNCSVSNIKITGDGVTSLDTAASTTSLPALNNSDECSQKDIFVTGTVLFDDLTSIVDVFGLHTSYNATTTSRVLHPLKSTLNTASRTRSNLMVYSGSLGSTNLNTEEYFNIEEYRVVSGTYNNQSDPTTSGNKWNSSLSVNDNGNYPTHADGLAFLNGYLVSPKKLGVAGDTRNVADGGTLQAPAQNPNYSTLTNATRTFVRFFRNNTTNDRSSITLTLRGTGSLVKRSTSLGVNGNFYMDAKIPGKTAWLDVGKAFSGNNATTDGAGALDGADPGNPAIVIAGGGTSVVCNFNGQSLLGTTGTAEYVMIRITADEDWLGYLSRLSVAYS